MTNIQNTDDYDCFKWCLVRYLNPANHDPARITKVDKDFTQKPDFKDIKFTVKIRGIPKIEKKNSIDVNVLAIKIMKNSQSMYLKKCFEEKNVNLLLIGEEKKNAMLLSKTLIFSCMIIHYIVEENIFVVMVYTFSLQKKF